MIGSHGFIARGLAAACLGAACVAAVAQTYPSKPVRWLVPSAPGGAFDLLTRAFAPHVSTGLAQPFVIENRAAVSGIAGVEAAARAAPDGYTIMTAGNPQMVFNKHMHRKLPYDPIKDFAPITELAALTFALHVHTDVPATTLQEFIAYAKAHPGKLNYGSGGAGQAFHLAMELLKARTGVDIVHVAYKGNGPALLDFFAGRVEVMFYPPTGQILGQIKGGKIRPLAVVSDQRLAALPDVPTFAESGVPDLGSTVSGWVGVFGPAGTPPAVVMRLNQEMIRVMGLPELKKVYATMNVEPMSSTPGQFAQRIAREIAFWEPVIRKLGIELE